ncbi:hypothetical protein HK104_004702 [Borealophlyctis nickersoniae]|nr:hypothetical protein HK104_004702 [Borealophlyctis nickersoniae]
MIVVLCLLFLPALLAQPNPAPPNPANNAHSDVTVAGPGAGAPPPAPAAPAPAPAAAPAAPPAAGGPPAPAAAHPAPGAAPGGLPDFVPDQEHLQNTLSLDYIDAAADPCLIQEKCLGGDGQRTIVRFGSMVHNKGTADAFLGNPPAVIGAADNPPYWIWDPCHGHWHFTAYADYELLSADRTQSLGAGHKNGFCLEDVGCDTAGLQPVYNCNNQGITAGCWDLYDQTLACQWIDITDLINGEGYTPQTEYTIKVHINPQGFFPELSGDNNLAFAKFTVAGLPAYQGPAVAPPAGAGGAAPPPAAAAPAAAPLPGAGFPFGPAPAAPLPVAPAAPVPFAAAAAAPAPQMVAAATGARNVTRRAWN